MPISLRKKVLLFYFGIVGGAVALALIGVIVSLFALGRPSSLLPLLGQVPVLGKVRMGSITGTVKDAKTGQPLAGIPVHVTFTCPHGIDPFFDSSGRGFRCDGVESVTEKTDARGKFTIPSKMFSRENRSVSYTLIVNGTDGVGGGMNASTSYLDGVASNHDGTGVSASAKENGYHASVFSAYYPSPFVGMGNSAHYEAALIKDASSVADCASLPSGGDRKSCIQLLAYNAAEKVWKHGGAAPSTETSNFFEDYFFTRYMAELSGTCAENDCMMIRAVENGDLSSCGSSDKCKMWVAVFGKDHSLCGKVPKIVGQYIKNPYTDGKCLLYSAIWAQDRSICDRLGVLYQEESRQTGFKWTEGYLIPTTQCWTEFALKDNDTSICNKVPDVDMERNNCIREASAKSP